MDTLFWPTLYFSTLQAINGRSNVVNPTCEQTLHGYTIRSRLTGLGQLNFAGPTTRLLTHFAAELDWEKLLVRFAGRTAAVRGRGEREREREREGTEIKLFSSGGSRSPSTFGKKLHKNRWNRSHFPLTQSRYIYLSVHFLIRL